MKIVAGGRRCGKTTEVLKLMRERPDATLVVHHEAERTRLLRANPWLTGDCIITYDQTSRLKVQVGKEVLIDNAEMFFNHFFGRASVTTITMTADEVKVPLFNPFIEP